MFLDYFASYKTNTIFESKDIVNYKLNKKQLLIHI